MKNSKILLVAMAILLITTCKRDKIELTMAMLSGKWQVIGSTTYKSFEFNKSGTYIVIKNSGAKGDEVLYGDYKINNETVTLYDFGKLQDVKIENDNLNAVVIEDANPGASEVISTTKAAEYVNTTRTDLLCRTWKIISWNDQEEIPADAKEVLFSQAGTYLVTYSDGSTGLSTWQWKDSDEVTLCYSWEGNPTCNGNNEVEITDLTSTSCSIIEYGDVYKLVPASSTLSGRIIPKQQNVKSLNFFGRSRK